VVHRASSHLAVNVHFHSLVADGVYVQRSDSEPPEFHALCAPSRGEVMSVAWETCEKTLALLRRRGLWMDVRPEDDEFGQTEPGLAQCYSSSIAGVVMVGSRAGERVLRIGVTAARGEEGRDNEEPFAALGVTPGYGFSVHAARRVSADDKSGRERLARYALRPAVAQNRLKLLPDGKVLWELKRMWSDGTRHFVFEPLDFLSKLAALVFPPRMHRIRYHGAWARRSKLRRLVSPKPEGDGLSASGAPCVHELDGDEGKVKRRPRYDWAALLARVWAIDVLECPRCQGRMQRVAWVMRPDAIKKILASVGMPADSPEPSASRWPAQPELFEVA
jgi:hypothetical protein